MIKIVIDSSSLLFILSFFIFVPMGGVTLRSGWSWDHPNLKKKKKICLSFKKDLGTPLIFLCQ